MKLFDATLVATLLLCRSAVADQEISGGVIVHVSDSVPTHCINSSNEKISLQLVRLVTNKSSGWFSQDRSIGLLIRNEIAGDTDGDTQKVVVPSMFETSVVDYEGGRVSIPVQKNIISGFKLTNGKQHFSTASVELTVLKKKQRGPLSDALSALSTVTSQLPFPGAEPFSAGFRFFSMYANYAIDKALAEDSGKSNVDSQSSEGTIALQFSDNGECDESLAKTGTIALLRSAPGSESDGIVNLGKLKSYCFAAQVDPVFMLNFAVVSAGQECSAVPKSSFNSVNNPYTAFLLQAVKTVTGTVSVNVVREVPLQFAGFSQITRNNVADVVAKLGHEVSTRRKDLESDLLSVSTFKLGAEKGGFGTVTKKRDGNSIVIHATRTQAVAYDFAEAYARCLHYKIPLEDCM